MRGDRVRIDTEVVPGEPTEIVQWGLRYEDGQTLIRGGEEKTRREHAAQKPDDPCVVVTRTITVTTTEWAEPSTLADVLADLAETETEMNRVARQGLRGLT